MKQNVIIGISAGIAAVKIPELIERLKEKYDITVIMTRSASEIISPQKIREEANVDVYENLFENPVDTKKILSERKVEHIQLAGSANCIVIAPATANTIAKIANGIADDYLTTTVLAAVCPVIICPSMNVHMWHNTATQENIQKLKNMGYQIIDPDTGMLACGYEGQGRLANISTIAEETENVLQKSIRLAGKKVIVTAGGTREMLDDVRFLGNRSSGKMGIAIAEECFLQGADVLLIRAKTAVAPRFNMKQVLFETSEELEKILEKEIKHANVLFHVAAVSDFTIERKIGKISSENSVTLELIPREKILSKVKSWNKDIYVIGFKAESGGRNMLLQKSKKRLEQTGSDVIIANIVSETKGFEADLNEVDILKKSGEIIHIPLNQKKDVAKMIIKNVL